MRGLNEGRPGRAAILKAKVSDADVARLAAVASALRLTRSAAMRRALRIGLGQLERDADARPRPG